MVECSIKKFGLELLILSPEGGLPLSLPPPCVFTHCKAVLAPSPVPLAHSQLATS